MTEAHFAIELFGLTVRFGASLAVDDLSLRVEAGEVFGFLGQNGAGKTTTIRCLLDLLRPDAGEARLFGIPVRQGGPRLRSEVGFLPGDLSFFSHLSGKKTLALFAGLQGGRASRQAELLERLDFPLSALDRPVGAYSTGMRRALGLVTAFQHDPRLAILDEPTNGLDPRVRERFLDLVRDQKKAGRTTFLSSHVLDEIERTADRLALIEGGRLRLVQTLVELRAELPREVWLTHADGRRERRLHRGPALALLDSIPREGLTDISITPGSLEELFREGQADHEEPKS